MNKILNVISVLILLAIFTSCSKSKEEKFIDDFEAFVEQIEEIDPEEKQSGIEIIDLFGSKVKSLYGIDLEKSNDIMECINSSELKMNDDQKEKVFKLMNRLLDRMNEIRGERREKKTEEKVYEYNEIEGTYDLKGVVDKYPVTMHLEIEGSQIKGSYYYDKQGASSKLKLSGTAEDGLWDINETDADGTPTGHFKGKYVNGVYSGHFVTNQGKKMPFSLTKGDVDDSDFEVDSDYDDNDIEASSSSGSEDWDELLDSYENYVDKYISYVKKAAKGDMTALAESPSLMVKAQEFSSKMQNAQGEMSVSQWARYTKITMKMMKAAQEMQQ